MKSNLATLIDRALEVSEQMAALKQEDAQLRQEIFRAMKASSAEVTETAKASAQIRRSTVAQIDDEQAFFDWAKLKANRDVLKVGVVGDAWRARLQSNVKVPGVSPFTRETLYVIKAKQP